MYYTTQKFSEALIQSVINYMTENRVEVMPLDFLCNRNDYGACDAARAFYKAGYRHFTVKDGELHVHGVYKYSEGTFDWIVSERHYGYEPVTIHHCMQTEDLIALVQIAYDTIGSVYFKKLGVETFDIEEIEELERSYEERRNEV